MIVDKFDEVRGWQAYALLMIGFAAAFTILPNATSSGGNMGYIEGEMHISRYAFSAICLVSGIIVFFRKPTGNLLILCTTPLLFYCITTLFYLLAAEINLASFLTHLVLYVGILRDVSRPTGVK